MAGVYRTVVNTPKLSKVTPIIIGTLLSIPLVFAGIYFASGNFTRANDPVPHDVIITEITQNSAKVVWTTDQDTQTVIEYGTAPTALTFFAPEAEKTKQHSIDITLLTPSTTHYFQIRAGDKAYDNGGVPWTFTTRAVGSTTTGKVVTAPSTKPVSGGSSGSSKTIKISGSTKLQITTTQELPTVCGEIDCAKIRAKLGRGCKTEDYVKAGCIKAAPTVAYIPSTPAPTSAPTAIPITIPSPTPVQISSCSVDYIQPSSCQAWSWGTVDKNDTCRKSFYRYYLQCKNNSFVPTPNVTPPADIWYYNGPLTDIASNSATIPNPTTAPTPHGTVYCQVRAEDAIGGDSHATQWVRAYKSDCP